MHRYFGFSGTVRSAGRRHVCFYFISFIYYIWLDPVSYTMNLYYNEMLRVPVVTASCVVKGSLL